MSPSEQLQDDITAYLAAAEELFYVPVHAIKTTSEAKVVAILDKLNTSLAGIVKKNGKAGLGVLVPMPSLKNTEESLPGLNGDCIISVQIIENELINAGEGGTGVSAEELGVTIGVLLQHMHFIPGNPLVTTDVVPLPLSAKVSGSIGREVIAKMRFSAEAVTRAAMPMITEEAGLVTLECATAGADILYTTDGTLPVPDNATSALYSVPFTTPASGTLLRTMASATGKTLSPVNHRRC